MASPSARPDGAVPDAPAVAIGAVPGGDRVTGRMRLSARAPGRPARSAIPAPPDADGVPEEVAVCELCGLVSRLPRPVVCPACGAGYG